MKKILIIINFMLLPFAVLASTTDTSTEDSKMNFRVEYKKVDRKEALTKFFKRYNSPLIDNVDKFIEVADIYGIDYRLIPSISCMESTCGKVLIKDSYNPFGWGIYGTNVIYFKNYDEAIKVVGEGLNKGYFAKGYDTVEEIAPIYTPPNHYNWKNGVTFFMNQISKEE